MVYFTTNQNQDQGFVLHEKLFFVLSQTCPNQGLFLFFFFLLWLFYFHLIHYMVEKINQSELKRFNYRQKLTFFFTCYLLKCFTPFRQWGHQHSTFLFLFFKEPKFCLSVEVVGISFVSVTRIFGHVIQDFTLVDKSDQKRHIRVN